MSLTELTPKLDAVQRKSPKENDESEDTNI